MDASEIVRMISSERPYPIQRPLAAALAGATVAILGDLIGLGGAEFRQPILISIFALYPRRAMRTNLLISRATLARRRGALEFPADGQRCGFSDRNCRML
jgi:hypothetical protein